MNYSFEKPQKDYETGSWEPVNPQSILNFTAAGYFFAVKLFEKYWKEEGAGHFNGVVWFRKGIEIPSSFVCSSARLFLGNVVDEDTVYINGTKIGTVPMQYIPSNYDIPEDILKEGKNTIAVRVVSCSGKGGFYKGRPYQLQIGKLIIDLCGEWQYMIGVKSEPMPAPVFVSWRLQRRKQPMGINQRWLPAPFSSLKKETGIEL